MMVSAIGSLQDARRRRLRHKLNELRSQRGVEMHFISPLGYLRRGIKSLVGRAFVRSFICFVLLVSGQISFIKSITLTAM